MSNQKLVYTASYLKSTLSLKSDTKGKAMISQKLQTLELTIPTRTRYYHSLGLLPVRLASSVLTSIAARVPSSMAPSINPLQPRAQSALAKMILPCRSLKLSRYFVAIPGLSHSQAPSENSSLCLEDAD
jgi:hypothetical protein